MKSDQPQLHDYLLARSGSGNLLVPDALGILDAYFFGEVPSGCYALATPQQVRSISDYVCQTLQAACGQPVKTLKLYSSSAVDFTPPDFRSDEVKPLTAFLLEKYRDDLRERLGSEAFYGLAEFLMFTLGDAVFANVAQAHQPFLYRLEDRWAATVAATPMACIFYLLGYALIGDADKHRIFVDLVLLCRDTLPIGVSLVESETGLFLVG